MHKLPKYVEIEEYYKDQIEKGIIPNGALFPPENEISQQFSASHMTITKAMNELSSKGYIKRIPGKGTFASNNYKAVIKKPLFKSNSISAQILASGMKPRTELYKYSIIKAKEIPNVAKKMKIGEDDFVHYFIRLRYGDDNLVCISYTYITQNIIPSIDIARLEGSFNTYVDELNIHRSYGSTEFCATLPTAAQAKIIGTNHVLLFKQTILWNVENSPFELTYHYFIGEKYTVTQDLQLKYNEDGQRTKEPLTNGEDHH